MGEPEETRPPGRPQSKTGSRQLTITNMDVLTFRMLGTLVEYGRFGRSRPEVALFVLRSWLWDNEARLKSGIATSDKPLGMSSPEPDGETE